MNARYSRKDCVEVTKPFRGRSYLRSTALLGFDIVLYVILFYLTLHLSNLGLKTIVSLAQGMILARLFVIGHDCCHGSFFPGRWSNKIAGRIAFLPTLTPFSLWELGHNVAHHSFPNLKGSDHVWTPMSKEEFDRAQLCRQLAERFYRTQFGLGAYYLIELWWKKLIFPNRRHVGARRPVHIYDNVLVGAWLIAIISLVIFAGGPAAKATIVVIACLSLILPFCVWNYLMGFVIYVQHTNPEVPWYANKKEWRASIPQISNTVHVTFSAPFNALLHNIMEHNAHHVDVHVPLYRLPEAQAAIELATDPDVLVQKWSYSSFIACLRTCKLYDYDSHEWLGFDGNVTARSKPSSQRQTIYITDRENYEQYSDLNEYV